MGFFLGNGMGFLFLTGLNSKAESPKDRRDKVAEMCVLLFNEMRTYRTTTILATCLNG